jgi:hypothetical protein
MARPGHDRGDHDFQAQPELGRTLSICLQMLKAAFPSETSSLGVVVQGKDVTAPAVPAAVEELEQATHRHETLFPGGGALEQALSPDKRVNTLTVQTAGNGMDEISARAGHPARRARSRDAWPGRGTRGGHHRCDRDGSRLQ